MDLLPVFSIDIFPTVNVRMACTAKRNNISGRESQRSIAGPRLDMVDVQPFGAQLRTAAPNAMIVVALENAANECLAIAGRVKSLPLRGASIAVVWIRRANSARHAIFLATQVRLWPRGGHRQRRAGCGRMLAASERINSAGLLHVVIIAGQILAAWSCWNAELAELYVNALRIAANNFTNVVRRQLFNFVLLAEPISV